MRRRRPGRQIEMRLDGSYTVEAAGVMSAVLLTILVLLGAAFQVHREVLESMKLHTSVEKARHAVSSIGEKEINMRRKIGDEELSITAPVFRPEDSLRLWSLLEAEL